MTDTAHCTDSVKTDIWQGKALKMACLASIPTLTVCLCVRLFVYVCVKAIEK